MLPASASCSRRATAYPVSTTTNLGPNNASRSLAAAARKGYALGVKLGPAGRKRRSKCWHQVSTCLSRFKPIAIALRGSLANCWTRWRIAQQLLAEPHPLFEPLFRRQRLCCHVFLFEPYLGQLDCHLTDCLRPSKADFAFTCRYSSSGMSIVAFMATVYCIPVFPVNDLPNQCRFSAWHPAVRLLPRQRGSPATGV